MSDTATHAHLTATFRETMAALDVTGHLAIAVSGGPDSMALLFLAHEWAKNRGVKITALTVDHQLRAEAANEAAMVFDWCAGRNIRHHTLMWERTNAPCGNLQAAAREARYALMGTWCADNKVGALAVAHHADDQAETLLMRLGRGSGVDGLAAMAASAPWPVVQAGAPRLLRPLLQMRRADIQGFGQVHGLPVVQDPSNQDASFDRVATRQAITALDMDVERLARTADLMGQEKAALDWAVAQAMAQVADISPHGFITLDRPAYSALPSALGARVLRHILFVMGQADYPPRKAALKRLQEAVAGGLNHTLAGVSLSRDGHLCPESLPQAADLPVGTEYRWDQRFSFTAQEGGWRIAARGDLVGSLFSNDQIAQISALPAFVRPQLPVLVGPDGAPHLPTFGEIREKVSVLGHIRANLTTN